jgi:hypothetical protein
MPDPHAWGFDTLEDRAEATFNAQGFIGAEITPRRAGETRIVCLGDSMTEGRHVPLDSTYPVILQRLLRARRHDENIVVFNGGRGMTNPAYVTTFAREYQSLFDPDWIVLMVHDADWDWTLSKAYEVHYEPTADGLVPKIRWEEEGWSPRKRWLLDTGFRRFVAFHYAYVRALDWLRVPAAPAPKTKAEASDASEASRELTLQAIDTTLRDLSRSYTHVVVVHLPYQLIAGDLDANRRPSWQEQALIEAGRVHHVPVLSLRAAMERAFDATHEPAFGFSETRPGEGHPNAVGHALVAKALADYFEPEKVGEPSAAAAAVSAPRP